MDEFLQLREQNFRLRPLSFLLHSIHVPTIDYWGNLGLCTTPISKQFAPFHQVTTNSEYLLESSALVGL